LSRLIRFAFSHLSLRSLINYQQVYLPHELVLITIYIELLSHVNTRLALTQELIQRYFKLAVKLILTPNLHVKVLVG